MTPLSDRVLQPFPKGTPSDAELQAQRDKDHAADVARWMSGCNCPSFYTYCHCDWPITEVVG